MPNVQHPDRVARRLTVLLLVVLAVSKALTVSRVLSQRSLCTTATICFSRSLGVVLWCAVTLGSAAPEHRGIKQSELEDGVMIQRAATKYWVKWDGENSAKDNYDSGPSAPYHSWVLLDKVAP